MNKTIGSKYRLLKMI